MTTEYDQCVTVGQDNVHGYPHVTVIQSVGGPEVKSHWFYFVLV